MGLRIHKALGYGVLFGSYEEFLEALTPEFNELYKEESFEYGVPLTKYLEWMMNPENRVSDTFVMDSLLTKNSKAKKHCLRDIINIVEDLPVKDYDGNISEDGVGFLIRPLQVLDAETWHRADDVLDYYSDLRVSSSWKELSVSLYPYESGERVDRDTGESVPITNSEYNYLAEQEEVSPLAEAFPGWENTIPKPPAVVEEILAALDVFRTPRPLPPVLAVWWE